MSLIIIPDTHGYYDVVRKMIDFLEDEGYLTKRTLAFLGDYFDNGQQVRKLVNFLIDLQKDGHIMICGNHEYVLGQALLETPSRLSWASKWFNDYQKNTLESFGLTDYDYLNGNEKQGIMDLKSRMTPEEISFVMNLPLYWENDTHILIHATVLEYVSWEIQRKELDNWSRGNTEVPPQLRQSALSLPNGINKQIVSGHIRRNNPYITKYRASIDLGVDNNKVLAAYIPDLELLVKYDKNTIDVITATPSK
jgi:serine/threonine protein phosphatase 1